MDFDFDTWQKLPYDCSFQTKAGHIHILRFDEESNLSEAYMNAFAHAAKIDGVPFHTKMRTVIKVPKGEEVSYKGIKKELVGAALLLAKMTGKPTSECLAVLIKENCNVMAALKILREQT
jgi:hypothetical protein